MLKLVIPGRHKKLLPSEAFERYHEDCLWHMKKDFTASQDELVRLMPFFSTKGLTI